MGSSRRQWVVVSVVGRELALLLAKSFAISRSGLAGAFGALLVRVGLQSLGSVEVV